MANVKEEVTLPYIPYTNNNPTISRKHDPSEYIRQDNYRKTGVPTKYTFGDPSGNYTFEVKNNLGKEGYWSFLWGISESMVFAAENKYGFNRDWSDYVKEVEHAVITFSDNSMATDTRSRFYYFTNVRFMFNTSYPSAHPHISNCVTGPMAASMFYGDYRFLTVLSFESGGIGEPGIDLSEYKHKFTTGANYLVTSNADNIIRGGRFELNGLCMDYSANIKMGVPCLSVGSYNGNNPQRTTEVIPNNTTMTLVHPVLAIPIRSGSTVTPPILTGNYTTETGNGELDNTDFNPLFGNYQTSNSNIAIHAQSYQGEKISRIIGPSSHARAQPVGSVGAYHEDAHRVMWSNPTSVTDPRRVQTQSLFRVTGDNNYVEVIFSGQDFYNLTKGGVQFTSLIDIQGDNNRILVRVKGRFSFTTNSTRVELPHLWSVGSYNGVNNHFAICFDRVNSLDTGSFTPNVLGIRADGMDASDFGYLFGYFNSKILKRNIENIKAANIPANDKDLINRIIAQAANGTEPIFIEGVSVVNYIKVCSPFVQFGPDEKPGRLSRSETLHFNLYVTKNGTTGGSVAFYHIPYDPEWYNRSEIGDSGRVFPVYLTNAVNERVETTGEFDKWGQVTVSFPPNLRIPEGSTSLKITWPWGGEKTLPFRKHTPRGENVGGMTYYTQVNSFGGYGWRR